jgi:hypothetical protein
MKEQTRIRLSIIEARYGRRAARAASEAELAADRRARFDDAFRGVRDRVLAPALEEIGAEIATTGHRHRVEIDAGEHRPSVALHLLLASAARGAPDSPASVIRLFTVHGTLHNSQIIAELEIRRTVTELTRFHEASAITTEVAEQMIVDAVEQIFAVHSAG